MNKKEQVEKNLKEIIADIKKNGLQKKRYRSCKWECFKKENPRIKKK